MSIIGSLVALLRSDTRQWSKGFNDAGKDVDRLNAKTKGFFKDLNSSFGKSSSLGKSFTLLAGGGAIAGLTLAGRQLKSFADELVQIRNEFDAGAISAGEMAEKVAGAFPVFGQFFQAGRSIRELFTGEQAEIARINTEAERTNRIIDITLRINKQIKQSLADEAAEIRRINREIEKHGKDRFTSRKIDIDQATDDTQRKRAKDKQSERDEFLKDDPGFKKLIKDRDAIQTKLAELLEKSNDATPVYFGGPGNAGMLAARRQYNELKDEYDKLHSMVEQAAKRRAEGLKAIDEKYANLAEKDAEKTAADEAQVAADLAEAKAKNIADADESIRKEQQRLKIQQLIAEGKEEQAAIQRIIDATADAKAQNLKDARDKLKGLGLAEDSDDGKQLLGKAAEANKTLDSIADSKIKEYRDNRRKALIDSIGDPIRRYQQEIEKWNSEVASGIITRAEADAAIAKLHQQLEETLGMKESPIERLRQEIAELQRGVELKIIDIDKAKDAINRLAQEAMPKVDYRAVETRPIRFEGRVQNHIWPSGGPLDDMRKTALAQLEEQKRIRKATEDAAKNNGNNSSDSDIIVTIPG